MTLELFGEEAETGPPVDAPLAARMRPRTVEEFVGQEHLLGPGKVLRRLIEEGRLRSLILYGPPGTGKTSLAMILARATGSHLVALSAVTAGIREVRQVVEDARRLQRAGRRTVLLVDEIHRFNKAQQDALLPHVEEGTVTLVGVTTENPFFEVIAPLVSRSRIFEFQPLSPAELRTLLQRALQDAERGLGGRYQLEEEALELLVRVSNGDARVALSGLELAATASQDGRLTREGVAQALQRKAVLYDKEGDYHFDVISAFIKSVRGSDPDAALYWLARMIDGGEDPRFIVRRLIILASEDVGNADPQALVVATAAARALEWVGLPEAQYALAQATLYLATAPKSNSAQAYFQALADVRGQPGGEVPQHLKDPSRDASRLGHGRGYLYPHDYPGHYVPQSYLPPELAGRSYYRPKGQGYEEEISRRLEAWRRHREAASMERRKPGGVQPDAEAD